MQKIESEKAKKSLRSFRKLIPRNYFGFSNFEKLRFSKISQFRHYRPIKNQ